MKNLSRTILTVVAVGLLSGGLFCQKAQATFITGDIQFNGTAAFDTMDLHTATEVTAFTNVKVAAGGTSGSFISIPDGTSVSMAAPWIFKPSTATIPLWSVSFGLSSFTFDLATVTSVSTTTTQGVLFFEITGNGTVSGAGFAPTPGIWSFTIPDVGGATKPKFAFSADTAAAAVPDGGATAALLGLALAGVEVSRRKLKAA
jgi:VPDSG-CTERM motif